MASGRSKGLTLLRWLCLLPIPLLWLLAEHYGYLKFAEDKLLDWRFNYRGEIDAPVKLVYVDIDSRSLEIIGNWSWDRAILARTCQALIEKGKVRAIGIDIVMSDVGQPQIADLPRLKRGNVEFARYAETQPPIVLAASFSAAEFYDHRGEESFRSLPIVANPQRRIEDIEEPEKTEFRLPNDQMWSPGLVGLIDTYEGGTRMVPLYAPTKVQNYYHMSVELVRLYHGIPRKNLVVEEDQLLFKAEDGMVLRSVPLTDRQFLEINWFSPWVSPRNPHVTLAGVFTNADVFFNPRRVAPKTAEEAEERAQKAKEAEAFFADPMWKDAIVLIGPVDKLLQDLGPAPYDSEPVPKVGVHGNAVKTILSGRFVDRAPEWANILIAYALSFAITGLSVMSGPRSVFAKTLAVLTGISYAAVSFELFRQLDWVLPITAPLSAAFATSFVAIIWQLVEEEKAKGRIKGMFGTYLAPAVVQNLIESGRDPELGGHDAEITPYFSDIQSFSSFSEVMSSSRLGELLNEYLSACTDIVQAEAGTLDKFIGDAVVAMYGAPVAAEDHAYRACRAAIAVQKRIGELRETWKAQGETWPALVHRLRTRIGLNTGVCMIGNMGSRTRFNYTMMGDNVNLAARMESGAKSWGVYTMCTETTRLACEAKAPGLVVFRPLGRIVVKGRSQPVPINEIMGFKEELPASTFECMELFAKGLDRMYQRDWDGSLEYFRRSAELEPLKPGQDPGVASNASLVRIEKVEYYRHAEPVPDWDGVEVMTEK